MNACCRSSELLKVEIDGRQLLIKRGGVTAKAPSKFPAASTVTQCDNKIITDGNKRNKSIYRSCLHSINIQGQDDLMQC